MFSKGVRLMILATISFSLMQVGVKYLKHIPFNELILFRSVISLLMSYFTIHRLRVSPWGNDKIGLILRGVFGTLALSFFFISVQNLPLASSATLSYLAPIFTAIFAIFILGEKVTPLQWLCFGTAFIGVVLIRGFRTDIQGIYIIYAILSAVFSGLAYNMVRKLKDSDIPVVIVFYFPLVATPVMAVWSAFNWVMPKGWDWPVLIAIGILTQIGQINLSKALQLENAGRISSINFLGIIIAGLFSIFIFHETYSLVNIFGVILVIVGVLFNVYLTKNKSD